MAMGREALVVSSLRKGGKPKWKVILRCVPPIEGAALICGYRKFTPTSRNNKSSSPFLPQGCFPLAVLHSAVDFRSDGPGMTGLLTSNEGAYVVCRV